MTKDEARKRKYGGLGGSIPYNDTRCVEGVWKGWHHTQCLRKNGHGPEGLYCKQHDPVRIEAKREAERLERERERAWRRKIEARNELIYSVGKYVIESVEAGKVNYDIMREVRERLEEVQSP